MGLSFVTTLVDPPGKLPATILAFRRGLVVGHLEWDISSDGGIVYIEVRQEWRRRGIATALFRVATETSEVRGWPHPRFTQERTADGDGWATFLGAEPVSAFETLEDYLRDRAAP